MYVCMYVCMHVCMCVCMEKVRMEINKYISTEAAIINKSIVSALMENSEKLSLLSTNIFVVHFYLKFLNTYIHC